MSDNNEYLAECPFCAVLAKKESDDPYDGYQGNNTVYRVKCRKCGAAVTGDSYDEAVRKWNKRCGISQEMTAREFMEVIEWLDYYDHDTYQLYLAKKMRHDYAGAVAIVERWAREHPERSED